MNSKTAATSDLSNESLTQTQRIFKCVLVASIAIAIGIVCGFC